MTTVRSWARRALRIPFRLLPAATVVRVPAGPMRGMRWMPASMPHGAWLGRLERTQLAAFLACLQPGMTVWDVGANVGLYAIPSGRAVGARGRVFAFEPIERNVRYLRRHVELNGLTWVHPVQAAVAESSGASAMLPGDSPSEARLADGGPWPVRVVALDDWRSETGTAVPALVKIDVEGAEDRVLAGAVKTLAAAAPIVFLSLHGERQRRACGDLLESLGYRIESLQPGVPVEQATEWRGDRPASRRDCGRR